MQTPTDDIDTNTKYFIKTHLLLWALEIHWAVSPQFRWALEATGDAAFAATIWQPEYYNRYLSAVRHIFLQKRSAHACNYTCFTDVTDIVIVLPDGQSTTPIPGLNRACRPPPPIYTAWSYTRYALFNFVRLLRQNIVNDLPVHQYETLV